MFAKSFNVKKITLFLIGLAVFVMSLYFLASHAIFAYRMSNIRKSYMESYAGCEMKSFHQGIVDNINRNWKKESEEAHFNHSDVVEYMMQHCPPKEDEYYDKLLIQSKNIELTQKNIISNKEIRNYQLKFIDKKFDVFHE